MAQSSKKAPKARRQAVQARHRRFPLGGPTEVISATVPREIVCEVRDRAGKREFSGFVARAMHNELVRLNQQDLIDEIVAANGPLDEVEMRSMERLFAARRH